MRKCVVIDLHFLHYLTSQYLGYYFIYFLYFLTSAHYITHCRSYIINDNDASARPPFKLGNLFVDIYIKFHCIYNLLCIFFPSRTTEKELSHKKK